MREHLRGAAISAGVGVGIVFLATMREEGRSEWRAVAYGALIGVFGYVFCAGAAWILRGWLGRTRAPRLARAAVYCVAGILSWMLANAIAMRAGIIRAHFEPTDLAAYLPVVGGISLLLGLLFYTYGLLQDRLRDSVERLKEAEFAEKELEIARSIQQRILPPQELTGEGFRIAARNLAARFVAGDFYDFFRLPDGAVGVVVADVAGKGVGASLIMATVKATLPFLAAERSGRRRCARPTAAWPRASSRASSSRSATCATSPRRAPSPSATRAFRILTSSTRGARPRALSAPGPRFPLGARPEVAYEEIQGVLARRREARAPDRRPARGARPGRRPARLRALRVAALGRAKIRTALFAAVRGAARPGLDDDWTALFLERRPA